MNFFANRGCDAVDSVKPGAAAEKAKETAINARDAIINTTGEGVDKVKSLADSASTKTSEGFEATKTSAANAWDHDHTKDTAPNVTDSVCNKGSDIFGSVMCGAEAGWNKTKSAVGYK